MNRNARKALNALLADALRANGLPVSGPTWEQAKGVRDDLIAQGTRAKSACNKAAFRMARADDTAREVLEMLPEPVTQVLPQEAPKADARPKAMPEQAKRVQEGKVMRDAKGRIVSRAVQEAFAELMAL